MKRKLMVLVIHRDHSWLPKPTRTDGNVNDPGRLCKTGSPPTFTKARELEAVLERLHHPSAPQFIEPLAYKSSTQTGCGNGLPFPSIQ